VQGVQLLLAQGPVSAQPLLDFGEWLKSKPVDPSLRFVPDLDKSRLPQYPKVPRNARTGNGQQCGQLTRRRRTVGEGL
jgi:hypothetical protein